MFGSTASSGHADDNAVRLPFFNMTNKYNKFSTAQTDKDGRYHAKNLGGYGRTLTGVSDGFVPGSLAIKFYNAGYQELGLQGITPSTPTGITASTALQFTIAVDGGSAYDLDVTIDASNTNFGGNNGLISKIQQVFDQAYYTSGNLFEKRVFISIVNGDIRFTSGSRLSTSAITLGDSSGGDTDIWGAGRIPAVANIEGAVDARLPDDTIRNPETFEESKNNVFCIDDGRGNLSGVGCTGTFNLETGEIDFIGPAEANFVFSVAYLSAHSGGVATATDNFNHLQSIGARSTNSKRDTNIKIEVFN